MQKVLFFISQDIFAKNYLTFESFKQIEEKYECSYLATEQVKIFREKVSNKKNFLGFLSVNNNKKNLLSRIFSDALLLANRDKSSSFSFRVIMRFNLNFRNVIRKPFWKIPFRVLIRLFYSFTILSTRLPIALIVKNKFLKNKTNNLIHKNKNIRSVLQKLKPDLIIIPNSGADTYFFQLIVESKKKENHITTFALIDNWDNLSTKSIIPDHPDFIGVWGEQSKKHAIEIQNFKSEQCKVIGSARYQKYFDLRNENLKSHFDFEYILFLGTSWNWNEEGVLNTLDHIISRNDLLNKKFKIIYRPHPFRQGKTIPMKFKNIIYDPEILDILKNNTHKYSDLNYYPSLIKNAKFIIGGPQTMMIESTIFNKFYLALTHDDKINYSNMKKVFETYEHFRGIENIETIHYCDDLSKIEKKMIEIISLKPLDINKVDYQRNYFLFNDEKKYEQRISNIVDEILKKNY